MSENTDELDTLLDAYIYIVLMYIYIDSLDYEKLEMVIITVEYLNKGHIGNSHFVHYREVVLFSEV